MIPFPTQRADFNLYIYQSSQGLVNILFIGINPNDNIEFISYTNQDQQIFVEPISNFTEANFTPILRVNTLNNIISNIDNVRGLGVFSQSFNDPN